MRLVRETQHDIHSTALVLAQAINVAPDIAVALLTRCDGSLRLLRMTPKARLLTVAGFGNAAYTRLTRFFAGADLMAAELIEQGVPLRGPRDVAAVYSVKLQDLEVEEFHVAILDAQHRMKRDVLITRGLLNSSLVHPREVFVEAISDRAAAIILIHNHPSGDPTPSAEDRQVTEQLVAAGRLLDIPVHDHIIIGRGRYTSFAEAGLL